MLRLLNSYAQGSHFLIGGNHLLSVSPKHRLLNSQELAPHQECILVRSHLLEEVSEDGDDFLQEGVVSVTLAVGHLLLEGVLQSQFHSKDRFFRSLSHKNHRVD